jgi:hypothetical protein
MADHLAEGQHPCQLASLHDDHRADVVFGHHDDRFRERRVRMDGEQRGIFDLQNFFDLHVTPWK